jgi:hypothetical protein
MTRPRTPALFVHRIFLLVLLFPAAARAQSKLGDPIIEKFLAQETAKLSQRFLDGAATLEQWEAASHGDHRAGLGRYGVCSSIRFPAPV